jgi:hypothetical protein
MSITFQDLADRLSPEAVDLFRKMVDLHLAATGDRMFMEIKSWGGCSLRFCADPGASLDKIDEGAIRDLSGYGLVQVNYGSRGTPNYRVGSDGLHFHKYLLQRFGLALTQVDEEVRRTLIDDGFAQRRREAAQDLAEAFDLLWTNRTDAQTVSEIGDHLRKALMDVTNSVLGDGGTASEQPVKRLRGALSSGTIQIPSREAEAVAQLVELVGAVLSLDHRLNHVRDEQDKRAEPIRWEELRRAAFLTAVVCYEIDRLT